MRLYKSSMVFAVLCAALLTGCKNEDTSDVHRFGNKLYISSEPVYSDLLIKEDITETSRTITSRVAIPAREEIRITFAARPEMTTEYNMIYGDVAATLPAEHYDIPEKVSIIKEGDVLGNDIVVNFKETNQLDRNERYVLPVTIADATNIDILESGRTVYFVFKGAALINVVANIADVYLNVNWSGSVNVYSMPIVTIETLLRSPDWEDGRENALSTVFGVEGVFLIRIGDADRPRDQLQLVSKGQGEWPAANEVRGLPVNEWVHIAIVFDTETGERIYYMNGEQVAYDKGAMVNANLSGSRIGYSWDSGRWLPGEMAELRVWNYQRSAHQIKDNPYWVDPESEGLVAYWKFNEGDGQTIFDATPNGSHLTTYKNNRGNGLIKWVDVELPPLK